MSESMDKEFLGDEDCLEAPPGVCTPRGDGSEAAAAVTLSRRNSSSSNSSKGSKSSSSRRGPLMHSPASDLLLTSQSTALHSLLASRESPLSLPAADDSSSSSSSGSSSSSSSCLYTQTVIPLQLLPHNHRIASPCILQHRVAGSLGAAGGAAASAQRAG
ncbi:hypothetical protein, conserved [Eimeria acervulina]|uniref:Uncharacterized protein n=1 Tax=Eimeria acervulina TaxID=5801 RepID=U6GH27_EIMAC|nr:hypothetical protein, conserved [Eimeria acervulina]CDI79485.1 hypothetical protein, conserved [Eimeria acervulina]